MKREEYFPAELARLEEVWRETQDLRIVAEAFNVCAPNDWPLPDWTHPAIRQAIAVAFSQTGPMGLPGRGGYRDLANREDVHIRRHSIASWALRLRDSGELAGWKNDHGEPFALTREGAFRLASQLLRGSPAQGGWRAIETSFNLIQRRDRNKNTPDH